MGKIGRVEYIENNESYGWSADSFFEYGIKGVAANDLGYDYDQISEVEKIKDFKDEQFTIKTYLVQIAITVDYIKPYLMKVHCHFDNTYSIYYLQV